MADTSPYTQEYFNQLQDYYKSYNANPNPVDVGMLQDWYSQSNFQPGASISLPAAPVATPTTTAEQALAGLTSSSSSSDVTSALNEITDPAQQLIALQNPVVKAALGFMPFGLGGAISGYAGANAANQFNQIAGLYGGQVPDQVNPYGSAILGLMGFTPEAIQAASTLANQFNAGSNSTGVFAGYMQAGTDPVLGNIVNQLAEQAAPGTLSAIDYGTIGQAVGQQINEVIAATDLSYEQAAAVVASSMGLDSSAGGLSYSGVADTGYGTNAAGQTVSNDATIAAQDAANFGLDAVTSAPAPSTDISSGSTVDYSGVSVTDSGWGTDYGGGYDSYGEAPSSSSSSSDSGGGGGKIVCTAMNEAYGFGSFRNRIWLKYAKDNLTKAHEVGYHTLFLPLVDLGYKKNIKPIRNILEHIARHRSADLRAEMRGSKRDPIGRAYRFVLEPLCYLVGKLKGY